MRRHFIHNLHLFRRAAAVLLFFNALGLSAQQTQDVAKVDPAPKPAAQIDLAGVGYRLPSRADRLTEDEPSLSLDYVDADHVLLTFNRKQLFQRQAGCTPEHQDRLMHAAILEVPSGKVVKEADWYLHDRRRYLWSIGGPMGKGKFLLRRLNDLYLVDASLHETLLLHSPKNLFWVTVTPDNSQIVIETEGDAVPASKPGPAASPTQLDPKYVAQFLSVKTLQPQRTVPLNEVVKLTATSQGYADLAHKGDLWLIRFGPTPTRRHNIARVRSRTVPNVLYASDNSLLIGRCPTLNCDYSVTAFTLAGHRLWHQRWSQYRVFSAVGSNPDNSRFGVSTLRLAPATGPATKSSYVADDPDSIYQPSISQRDVFQQEIQVLETASGSPVLSVTVSPAVLSGQNFSLAPDGRHLALLHGSQLDVFDLPPTSAEEQAKFAALKSDVPDLYTLASAADSDSSLAATTDDKSAETTTAAADAAPDSSADKRSDSDSTTAAATSPGTTTAPAATSQNAAAPTEPLTTIRVSTRAVVVDVVVTDSKGHPVKGLHQQDFHLTEDGTAQNLHAFREFSDADVPPPADSTPTTPAKKSPNIFSNNAHTPDAGSVTLILFDLLNTPLQDQIYARQQLIKFLQSKPKNSQFALCTMSKGSRLRLIQGFTPDETLLLAAARSKKSLPKTVKWQVAAQGADAAVSAVSALAAAGPTSGFQGLLSALQESQVQEQVADTDERAGITIDSVMLLAHYLSAIPGRKNLVWLSGSFPLSLAAANNSGNIAVDNPNYVYKIKRVTNLLAEAQIAVYPVDVRGILGNGIGADSAGGMGGPTAIVPQDISAASVISPSPNIPQDMQALAQQASERDTLTEFANATGGKAFYNTNGIRQAIAIAAEQGANYYTVAYSPTNKQYNGKFRKIKVALAEKGYTLHYRQGYYADDANAAAKDAALARKTRAVAMQHGSPPSRQILFTTLVAPVGSKKKMDRALLGDVLLAPAKAPALPAVVEAQHYSIDYVFEGSALRFIPRENATYKNSLTLMVTSFDSEGKMLSGTSQVGTSNLEPAVYKDVIAGQFHVHQEVDVPVEAASIRLGIQDQMSNFLGTVEIPLPVPPLPIAPHPRQALPEIEPD